MRVVCCVLRLRASSDWLSSIGDWLLPRSAWAPQADSRPRGPVPSPFPLPIQRLSAGQRRSPANPAPAGADSARLLSIARIAACSSAVATRFSLSSRPAGFLLSAFCCVLYPCLPGFLLSGFLQGIGWLLRRTLLSGALVVAMYTINTAHAALMYPPAKPPSPVVARSQPNLTRQEPAVSKDIAEPVGSETPW